MKDKRAREPALRGTLDRPEAIEERRLYRDPFVGRDLCAKSRSLSPQRRQLVTQSCPRCGAARNPETPLSERPCLLEGIALDVLALEQEEDMEELRAKLDGPLPF